MLGAPRSGTTFLMGVLGADPALECVSGNLLPVGIAHLAAQDLPESVREGLQRSFRGALADYLTTGLYRSRVRCVAEVVGRRQAARPGSGRAIEGRRVERMLVYKEPFLAFAPELAYGRVAAGASALHLQGRPRRRRLAGALLRRVHRQQAGRPRGRRGEAGPQGRRAVRALVGKATPRVSRSWTRVPICARSGCGGRWSTPLRALPGARGGRALRAGAADPLRGPDRAIPFAQGQAIAEHLGAQLTAADAQAAVNAPTRARLGFTADASKAELAAGGAARGRGAAGPGLHPHLLLRVAAEQHQHGAAVKAATFDRAREFSQEPRTVMVEAAKARRRPSRKRIGPPE